jgi:carbamoyl-phosphate synthase large subunit
VAQELGFPLVVRPSYVLGGRAMAIIHDEATLADYLLETLPGLVPSEVKARYPNDKTGQINTVLGKNPLLFDRYLADAIEVDVDALCDGKTSSSPASWSISRRRASIRATRPARCRRARCRPS